MEQNGYTIDCHYVAEKEIDWSELDEVSLVHVATGTEVAQPTSVQVCWSEHHVHMRFDCCDDYIVSDYTERDDTIYTQDVIEVFIDEQALGTDYLEFEVSPYNVQFDAIIGNDEGKLTIGTEWDAEGWETEVIEEGANRRIYLMKFPHEVFRVVPAEGVQWRINLYRIDEDPSGERHYQAWAPTGGVSFHQPSKFGTMTFVR